MESKYPEVGMFMQQKTPQLIRCSLCGRMSHYMGKLAIDGFDYHFCSIAEAKAGIENYRANKAKGLTQAAQQMSGTTTLLTDTKEE